jgi:cytidine deaminase
MKKTAVPAAVTRLWKKAVAAQKGAYAPYSRYKVGAAFLGPKGRVFTGCNVENASYGGTVCAERVALLKAASEGVVAGFTELVVVVDGDPVCPCGLCLQVMSEFCGPKLRVWTATPHSIGEVFSFDELMPKRFDKSRLAR